MLAYSVNQRLHELGIRIALGAGNAQLVRLVVGQSMKTLAVGVSCGIVVTLLLGRLVASMLYDTSPSNPWVLAGASTVLLVTGAIATLVPALRATRADPVAALRAD